MTKYKISTKTETNIFTKETLLSIYRFSETICKLLNKERDNFALDISLSSKTTHSIVFQKL